MSYKTLAENCYYKTGRDGVVFEALDNLAPNLFNNNRLIKSNVFSSNSKFKFTLVDSRKTTGKGKAIYYNLDPDEVLLLTHLLSDGIGSSFKKRAGAYGKLSGPEQIYFKEIVSTFDRIDFARFDQMLDIASGAESTVVSFQKNIGVGGNALSVRKLTISFEEAMRSSSKWKLIIEEGEAIKDVKGNGLNIVKAGSYKVIDKTQLMLQANEIVTPISEAAKRVLLAQGVFYAKMKEAEADFTRRKIEAKDYEGERIDEWNEIGKAPEWQIEANKKALEEAKKKAEEAKNAPQVAPQVASKGEGLACSDCNATIDQKVSAYSQSAFGRPLCLNCQKKAKAEAQKTQTVAPATEAVAPVAEASFVCKDCGATITEKVNSYSQKVLGRPLCFNCQKAEKAK